MTTSFETLDITKFRLEGLSVVTTNINIKPVYSGTHQTQGRTEDIVENMGLTDDIYEYLADVASQRLQLKKDKAKPSRNLLWLYTKVTADEVRYVVAVLIMLENCASLDNNTFEKQWSYHQRNSLVFPLTKKRHQCIYQALIPTKEELSCFIMMMNRNFWSLFNTDKLLHVCVDETIFKYHPRMVNRQRADVEKESRNLTRLSEKSKNNLWKSFLAEKVGLAPIVHIPDKPHDGLFLTELQNV